MTQEEVNQKLAGVYEQTEKVFQKYNLVAPVRGECLTKELANKLNGIAHCLLELEGFNHRVAEIFDLFMIYGSPVDFMKDEIK